MAKGIRLGEIGRRDVLRAGLIGLGGGIAGFGAGPVQEAAAATPTGVGSRILVVVELSGANDGLNTIVPYTNDAYYRARPKLGLQAREASPARRSVRSSVGHGGIRAPVQGRPARDRPWGRLREPKLLAFHLDGLLADGGAQ